ncbi:MAG: nuclear transport factor 2 family protein [Sphingopyxis sp.]|nr:nuclear transport factor 2 family protein [Sphingopyxis sp.]
MMTILVLGAGLQTMPLLAQPGQDPRGDKAAVEAVLARYKTAIETLDGSKMPGLFAPDSEIVENGKLEGSFGDYLAHHLGPELAAFRLFRFSGYAVDVRIEGPVALASERYRFRIEPKSGDAAEREGVTTSVLRRVGESWQIVSMHSSSRKPKP